MEFFRDILSAFRPVEGDVLQVAAAESQPFVAVDSRKLRVEVAAGASARLLVLHDKPVATSLSVVLEREARLEFAEIFEGFSSEMSGAFAETTVVQAAGSACDMTVVQFTSANATYNIALDGAYVRNSLGALFLAGGEEHCVVDLRTAHNVADCSSDSLVKGIASGLAVGEFRGLVYVAPDAQRTDARQQSRNILLSETARIDTRPQLEIYADDVKCSHGATVGQMDAEAIFYMRQRGLSLSDARKLQIEGFIGDVVGRCGLGAFEKFDEALRMAVDYKMSRM